MICKFALVGILLLASSTLAVHPSQPEVSLDHRDENLQSESLSRVESRADDDDGTVWTRGFAGFILRGENLNYITASFEVPNLTGSDGAVLISTGIDIDCRTGSLTVVIQGNISSNKVSWSAWGQWLPVPRIDLDATIQASDVITVIVDASFCMK